MSSRLVGLLMATFLQLIYVAVGRADVAGALAEISSPRSSGEASRAVLQLQTIVRQRAEAAPTVREECLRVLVWGRDPQALRRAAFVLAGDADDTAVRTLADRLAIEQSHPMRAAQCVGLRSLLLSTPQVQPATKQAVLSSLERVLSDRNAPLALSEGALLAAAATGPDGFDFVVRIKEKVNNPIVKDTFYATLAETRDVRALPLLAEAVRNDGLREGLRIQAASAIASLMGSLKKSVQLQDAQIELCVTALASVLNERSGDQLFSVSLAALGRIVDVSQQSQFYPLVVNALSSAIAMKREAAIEALYASETAPDASVSARIQTLAQLDPEESVRAQAEAVLAKFQIAGK